METWWSEKPEEEYDKYMRRVISGLPTGAVQSSPQQTTGATGINATLRRSPMITISTLELCCSALAEPRTQLRPLPFDVCTQLF
jgi:hypothetical protein